MRDARGLAEHLARGFSGEILTRGSPGYDDARRVFNGAVNKHPALIARCRGTADVVAAVNCARDHGIEPSVRGGGHNVAGRAVADDALMIDLAPMKRIDVDAGARIARVEPGVTWGELNAATQQHGLATTGGVVSSTGIAGLTLGGGVGWLMSKHGLALDNLVSVEIVTADGQTRVASEHENADLFWAVRGAGANFGVACELEYGLHAVGPTVTGGIIGYPVDAARDVLHHVRGINAAAPDELTVFVGLTHAPDGSGTPIVGVIPMHAGPLEAGAEAVRALKQFGSPSFDTVGPMPYTDVNAMLDAAYPRGALNYWKSTFLEALSDAAIDTIVACFARCPSPTSDILLEHVHGEATRVRPDATAFPHRREGFNFLALGQCMDAADFEGCRSWVRETYAAVQPFAAAGRYMNYLDGDEPDDAVAAAYGENYARLAALKTRYDPGNLFRLNQNIPPG